MVQYSFVTDDSHKHVTHPTVHLHTSITNGLLIIVLQDSLETYKNTNWFTNIVLQDSFERIVKIVNLIVLHNK